MIHQDVFAATAPNPMEAHGLPPRQWLVVGGAPRSGTTVLGRALNRSASITLLHEYASHSFFAFLDMLFAEERRHEAFGDFNPDYVMLRQARDAAAIAGDILARAAGKRTPIVGTKFPGHQLWPRPVLPSELSLREIMIVRNPLETVVSSIEKIAREQGHVEIRSAAETAQFHWAHAWNYILLHEGEGLLCVALEQLAADPLGEAARIAAFIGIPNDLDLSGLSGGGAPDDVRARYQRLGLLALHEELRSAWSPRPWPEQREAAAAACWLHGVPMHVCGINFTSDGNHENYVQHGLNPAEPSGAWTNGGEALIVFRLPDPQPGDYRLMLNIGWSPRIGGETTQIGITVDDRMVGDPVIDLGELLDQRQTISLMLQDFAPHPAGTSIRVRIHNPRSPCAAGEGHDDRMLGCMLQSIRFERLLTAV